MEQKTPFKTKPDPQPVFYLLKYLYWTLFVLLAEITSGLLLVITVYAMFYI